MTEYPPTPPSGDYPPQPASGYPGYPQYSGGYPVRPPVGTNGLAIASLVCSVAGVLCVIGGIAGIICGAIALSQIKQTGEEGRGLALAGLIVGIVTVVIALLIVILQLAVFGAIGLHPTHK
jgi:hypothetical protein